MYQVIFFSVLLLVWGWVLVFGGEKFTLVVRPSGTEPKLKVYVTAKGGTKAEGEELTQIILDFIKKRI